MASPNSQLFTFSLDSKGISTSIQIPIKNDIKEIASKIVSNNGLPFYLKQNVLNQLEDFVEHETQKYYNHKVEKAIANTKEIDKSKLAERLSKLFKEECARYAVQEEKSNSEEPYFPDMYHSLIHSPAFGTMLNLEHSYALCVQELVAQRDTTIAEQLKKQSEEMEKAVSKIGILYSDKDINDLASKHFEESQRVSNEWDTKIGETKKIQKQEFHEWVTKVYEDYCSGSLKLSSNVSSVECEEPEDSEEWTPQQPKLEESYTIHLGSQLKVMHNLRLLSTDVLDFCGSKSNKQSPMVLQPQRLQMAMSLYSSNLSGLVLLVDNRINSYTGIKREFAKICQQSTELHFGDLEEQMMLIRKKAGLSSRASKNEVPNATPFLRPGDFYITRHSNLSKVHVVFHLVVDDSLVSSDINSRHSVILGLRQILRVAHEWDVCDISIPLLLAHDMAEEMTIPWCLKRAELVFKCIKGFMIEMASITGEETRTVQFLVPRGISEEFFGNLLAMLPGIFRVSNPLVLKSQST